MRAALHAEWTKLRTAPGTGWLLLGAAVTTGGVSALSSAVSNCVRRPCGLDPAKVSLTGVTVGQAVVAIVAVLVIGNEYATGMMRVTLTALPRRIEVLAAKAAVVTAAVLAAVVPGVAAALLAGRAILPGHGLPALDLGAEPVLRAGIGSVLYLTLVALLSLGVTAIVRSSPAAIGIVLGLLYVFPIVTMAVSDKDVQRHLEQLGPMSAGLSVQATLGLHELPIGPWQGLGVLAGWAATALVVGGVLLHRRDA
jgi:ABC-2 type transport system permease protein